MVSINPDYVLYKNGKEFAPISNIPADQHLFCVIGDNLCFGGIKGASIYSVNSKKWTFNKAITAYETYWVLGMAAGADGTVYLTGYVSDSDHNVGGTTATMWTIKDGEVTETLLHDGSIYESNAQSVDVDADGNVWVLTYRANAYGNGGIKLYRNGTYFKTVYLTPNGNNAHFVSVKGNDRYVISTVGDLTQTRIYKNETVLKTIPGNYLAASKIYFSKAGDMYFVMHGDSVSAVFKGTEKQYELTSYITSFAVVN